MTDLQPAISEAGAWIAAKSALGLLDFSGSVLCHFVICYAGTLAFLPDALRRNLDIGAGVDPAWPIRHGPSDAVSDHLQDLRLPVGRKGLVPRAEIENFPGAAPPATTRSKDFSALKPGNKD
jgi:hypothetical protein